MSSRVALKRDKLANTLESERAAARLWLRFDRRESSRRHKFLTMKCFLSPTTHSSFSPGFEMTEQKISTEPELIF